MVRAQSRGGVNAAIGSRLDPNDDPRGATTRRYARCATALGTMRGVTASSNEWLQAFAARLGVPAPSDELREVILALAGTAAHASERAAAPVACWLAAAAGMSADEALAIARDLELPAADD